MAQSMFGNMYGARQKDLEASRSAAVDAASLGGYKTMAAVAGEAGGMLGQGLSSAFGALPPEQAKQAKIDELMSQFPNPTTYEDYKTIAGEFMASGMQEQGAHFLGLAEDMNDNESTGDRKWSTVARNKRVDIQNEALNRGYRLTEEQINSIANTTPDVAKLHPKKATYVHPWMDSLNSLLSRIGEPNIANIQVDDTTDKDPTVAPTPSSVKTDLSGRLQSEKDTNDLQAMNTQFVGETKNFKENINTVESGINIVNQVRGGNTAALPQLSRMLAKFNSDNRISVPEVAQVMKMGGLGERITNSIHKFISGDISPGTLNDIEDMLVRIGQLDQGNYNAKMSEYKVKYGDRFDIKTLDKWLPASSKAFLTKAQLLEMAKEKLRQRGL
jgi:hypothetical protein